MEPNNGKGNGANSNHDNGNGNGAGNRADADTNLLSVDHHDWQWEQNYKRIEELKPLFNHLPASQANLAKVFEICDGTLSMGEYDKNYVGPLVLAKNVTAGKFEEWLGQKWGLHKSARLASGTVYTPQACEPDHGRLRGAFHKEGIFPILGGPPYQLWTGSGKSGDKNPDAFWHPPGQQKDTSSVIIEVGTSQSLPSLRRRAFMFCADTNSWGGLVYAVLVSRFANRLYVEVWRRVATQPGDNVAALVNNMADPTIGNLTPGTMQFVCNANATGPGFQPQSVPASYQWQLGLPNHCSIPAGNEILVGGPAVPIRADVLLNFCLFDD